MGDLRNKLPKLREQERQADYARRLQYGYTLFREDFDPGRTRPNLMLGEAVRMLQDLSGGKVLFWRPPAGGIGLAFFVPRRSNKLDDRPSIYKTAQVSTTADIVGAKRELCDWAVRAGMGPYRALPNAAYKAQVAALKALYEAPVSVPAGEWLLMKKRVQPRILVQFDEHNDRVRENIYFVPRPLGEVGAGGRRGTESR